MSLIIGETRPEPPKVSLAIAMPLGRPEIHHEAVIGIIETILNWPSSLHFRQSSYLPHNRAHLLQDFLDHAEKPTHLLWVDSDMGLRAHVVKALLEADLGAVGAPYVTKDPKPRPVFEQGEGERRGPCVPVARMGFGCVLFQRRTLEMFCEGQKSFVHQGRMLPDVFRPEEGTGDTEDWAFWRRWEAAGLPAYVHQKVLVPHYGDAAHPYGVTL